MAANVSAQDWVNFANQYGLDNGALNALRTQGWTPTTAVQHLKQLSGQVGIAGMSLSDLVRLNTGGATPPPAAPVAAPAPQQTYFGSNPTISSGTSGSGTGGGATTVADGQQPESVALQQMGQIDPASEALRQQLAQSYLTPLQAGAPQAGAPSAADLQSYLDLYAQVDPTGLAARKQLGSDLAAQEALGTQLDPGTQREVEQATRRAQIARGNVYGTPQMVAEAMTRGQAGLALQQQRQQALQSYLSSGQSVGDVAANLYQQGLSNYLNKAANYRANQQAALSYLGSGSTPYQAGAGYLNTAEQRAAMAAQGGPVYNPASLGQTYSGTGAGSFPQYGLDIGQQSQNWYNSLAAYTGAGGAQKNPAGAALGGAASGALSGAAAGTAAYPGVGTLIGAGLGAVMGGVGGYFSAPDIG